MPVLLLSEAGTGKSTLCMQIAKDLNLKFNAISLTKQTSVNALLGFISINGTYIPSQLRNTYEEGGIFLLDELDAADANDLLSLNTIENGYIAFPDGIVHAHKDFRLVATANPQDNHSIYTGRSKLDFSTMNRFYKIHLDRDPKLEENLTSAETAGEVNAVRSFLASQGSSTLVTMRDTIRIHKLKALGLDDDPVAEVVFEADRALAIIYQSSKVELLKEAEAKRKREEEDKLTQHDTENYQDFLKKVNKGL